MQRPLFPDLVVHLVAAIPARWAALHGSLAVSVQAGGATRKATLRLGDLDRPVEDGFDRRATAKLWFLGDAFDRFLDGTLPAKPSTREVIVGGDPAVLEAFGRFLQEGAAVLRLKR